jgi:cation diffusion facilitator CzcD-associated flavoprotein CzcO
LKAEKVFSAIDVYEQRENVGGLWNHTSEKSGDGFFHVPQTNPHLGLEKGVRKDETSSEDESNIFVSPLYDTLETNIPHTLMEYSDLPFAREPRGISLFPEHSDVLAYLEEYGKDVQSMIRFNTQIISVKCRHDNRRQGEGKTSWEVRSLHLSSATARTEIYDIVIVASGHYAVPYIPDIEGIREWHEKFPKSISHSKYFRSPNDLAEQKVIVVGSSASGLDISSQIAKVSSAPLYLSQKSESYLAKGYASNSNIEHAPQISRFVPEGKRVIFADGTEAFNVDSIVFCTGYFYSMPFLEDLQLNPIGDGTRVESTFKHLFYAPEPTLAFLALPQKVIPFPVAESQSAVLARVYSGRLSIPSFAEMQKWEADTIAERGSQGSFHTLNFPRDANYINELYDWAVQADSREGLENDGQGKLPKRWGPWEYWVREKFPAIKRAYGEKGDERRDVKSLEDLGFIFDPTDVKLEISDREL